MLVVAGHGVPTGKPPPASPVGHVAPPLSPLSLQPLSVAAAQASVHQMVLRSMESLMFGSGVAGSVTTSARGLPGCSRRKRCRLARNFPAIYSGGRHAAENRGHRNWFGGPPDGGPSLHLARRRLASLLRLQPEEAYLGNRREHERWGDHRARRATNFSLAYPEDLAALDATIKYGSKFTNWRKQSWVNPLLSGNVAIHFNNRRLKDFVVERMSALWPRQFSVVEADVQESRTSRTTSRSAPTRASSTSTTPSTARGRRPASTATR